VVQLLLGGAHILGPVLSVLAAPGEHHDDGTVGNAAVLILPGRQVFDGDGGVWVGSAGENGWVQVAVIECILSLSLGLNVDDHSRSRSGQTFQGNLESVPLARREVCGRVHVRADVLALPNLVLVVNARLQPLAGEAGGEVEYRGVPMY